MPDGTGTSDSQFSRNGSPGGGVGLLGGNANFTPPFGVSRNTPPQFPWREYISKSPGCTQQYVFGDDQSQATFTIETPWYYFVTGQATTAILGYAGLMLTSPKRISRSVPWRHPAFPHLYATKIASVQGIKFLGIDGLRGMAQYAIARITILFSNLPFRVVDDFDLVNSYGGKEYNRWVEKRFGASSEILCRYAGTHGMIWAEGPQVGNAVTFNVGQVVTKQQLTMIWHNVPAAALYGSDISQPPINILNGMAKVNSTTFLNYPRGTVLLPANEVRIHQSPIGPTQLGLGINEPSLSLDVVFPFIFFDPPYTGTERGHNLSPIPGDANIKWGLIRSGSGGGKTLYDYYDFEQLFVPA